MTTKKVLVINGPNLNLLGLREPGLYGKQSLDRINANLKQHADKNNLSIAFFQSNAESEIIERIHLSLKEKTDYIIINAAAYTHTSIGIRDALLSVNIPFIEVHLSNIYARESFRKHSFLADKALGVISGLGESVYLLAMTYIIEVEK